MTGVAGALSFSAWAALAASPAIPHDGSGYGYGYGYAPSAASACSSGNAYASGGGKNVSVSASVCPDVTGWGLEPRP